MANTDGSLDAETTKESEGILIIGKEPTPEASVAAGVAHLDGEQDDHVFVSAAKFTIFL